MKIGIFFNRDQTDGSTAQELLNALRENGAEAEILVREDDIGTVDRLVVLGGDGTMLKAARKAAECGVPLFGINYGHIGFLTEFERGETVEAICLALSDACDLIERSMLEVELNGTRFVCLNECSLQHKITPRENKVVKIDVQIDGNDAGEIVADGIIVATPTGSTAYSLSAGGSILMPECEDFIFTPVCALSLKSRPVVYPSSAELSFTIPKSDLFLYGDGKYLGEVKAGETVRIRKAKRCATFLTRNKKACFLKITEKIN